MLRWLCSSTSAFSGLEGHWQDEREVARRRALIVPTFPLLLPFFFLAVCVSIPSRSIQVHFSGIVS